MKHALFWTFLAVFVATAAVTLFGIAGRLAVPDAYLNALFTLLIVEVIAGVLALFKKADFFGAGGQSVLAKGICGCWWEFFHEHPELSVSHIEMRSGNGAMPVLIQGTAYNHEGQLAAKWRCESVCVNDGLRQLFYFWKGEEYHREGKGKTHTGIGLIWFDLPAETGSIDAGAGWFTAGNILELRLEARRDVALRRVTQAEADARSRAGSDVEKGRLALAAYSDWAAALPAPGPVAQPPLRKPSMT